MNTIDLRSDTVTEPTEAMREAMHKAQVGDDVFADDPSVNDLQNHAAEHLGFEAAIFAPSGTMTNLMAIMSHCERGDEYIVGHDAHTYKYEGGGAAVLGSVQPQPISLDDKGCMDLDYVPKVIKPDDPHFAQTRLLCIENTYHGKVLPMDYLSSITNTAREHNLACHLDGARAYNAAIYHGVDITKITQYFDSVSICLSKGLSAPVGSLLLGSHTLIARAHKWRKMLGGGMRQAGVLAAAGKIALTDMPAALQHDHDNAAYLAESLSDITGLHVRTGWTQTNMVWCDFDLPIGDQLRDYAYEQGINIRPSAREMRLVTHRHISATDIDYTAKVIRHFFDNYSGANHAQ